MTLPYPDCGEVEVVLVEDASSVGTIEGEAGGVAIICGWTRPRADAVQNRLSPSGLFCF